MKALVLTAPSKLELQDVPAPRPAADEVLIRVRACGICGSDLHGWDGSSGRRTPPLIMGHEAAGEIAAVGESVTTWQIGERVTFDSTIYCGECDYCRAGRINLCENRRVVGVAPAEYKQHGAFAEFLSVPQRILHRLPDDLPFHHAAMVEPVSIALHAVSLVTLPANSVAVVVGTGMIGLLVVQALRHAGAQHIVAIDREPTRLALARELGATLALRSDQSDLPAELAKLKPHGADVVFEVVGIEPTVQLALQLVRRGGDVVLVGNLAPSSAGFPLQSVVTREVKLHGSCGSAGEYPLAIDLIARGVVRVEPLITAVAPLDDGAGWFDRLTSPTGRHNLKVVLTP
jgi:L-iditol 2-dehydrogenase